MSKAEVHAVLAAGLLAMAAPGAFASNLILESFDPAPPSVAAGVSVTWTLALGLNASHPGEALSSADLVFVSGDGQSVAASGPLGVPATLAEGFVYPAPGSYQASVSGTVEAGWTQLDPVYATVPIYSSFNLGAPCPPTLEPGWASCVNGVVQVQTGTAVEQIGVAPTLHTESFAIDGSEAGVLKTSWVQDDPVYVTVPTYTTFRLNGPCPLVLEPGWVSCTVDSLGSVVTIQSGTQQVQDGTQPVTHTQSLAIEAALVTGPAAVPEPSTLVLIGCGLLGFGATARRTRGAKGIARPA